MSEVSDFEWLRDSILGKAIIEKGRRQAFVDVLVIVLKPRFRVSPAVRKQLVALGSKALKSMVLRHAEIASLSDLKQRIEAIKSR